MEEQLVHSRVFGTRLNVTSPVGLIEKTRAFVLGLKPQTGSLACSISAISLGNDAGERVFHSISKQQEGVLNRVFEVMESRMKHSSECSM